MSDASRFFTRLDGVMNDEYMVACRGKNPVRVAMEELATESLAYVLLQYSVFSREIVHLLEVARDSLQSWEPVRSELEHNIAEELGSSTKGESHYDILRRGMLDDFDVDVTLVTPSRGSLQFLKACEQCLGHGTHAFVGGGVYAIEATAVGEITILRDIADELSQRVTNAPLREESAISQFLDAHINVFEVAHKDDLQEAVSPFLASDKDRADFVSGFREVLGVMDAWWSRLKAEATDSSRHPVQSSGGQ